MEPLIVIFQHVIRISIVGFGCQCCVMLFLPTVTERFKQTRTKLFETSILIIKGVSILSLIDTIIQLLSFYSNNYESYAFYRRALGPFAFLYGLLYAIPTGFLLLVWWKKFRDSLMIKIAFSLLFIATLLAPYIERTLLDFLTMGRDTLPSAFINSNTGPWFIYCFRDVLIYLLVVILVSKVLRGKKN